MIFKFFVRLGTTFLSANMRFSCWNMLFVTMSWLESRHYLINLMILNWWFLNFYRSQVLLTVGVDICFANVPPSLLGKVDPLGHIFPSRGSAFCCNSTIQYWKQENTALREQRNIQHRGDRETGGSGNVLSILTPGKPTPDWFKKYIEEIHNNIFYTSSVRKRIGYKYK